MSDSDSDGSIPPPVSSLDLESSTDADLLPSRPPPTLSPEAELFKTLYDDRLPSNHGKVLSRTERKREGYISPTLTYGEIRFDTFEELFNLLREKNLLPSEGGTFVDVGCGIGKPVFAAALLHDFQKCTGIEILEDCYRCAVETLAFWTSDIKPLLNEDRVLPENLKFSFLNNDATLVDWSGADVVFMNSTMFNMALMLKLSVQCRALREGAIIVTTTRKIVGRQFELVHEEKMEESWGEAQVYVFRRLAN
ncbi:hypothetical protein TeGR_g7918 [Tetraparma gracilis]|uniref:Histone-lysine N-methyltransferase, H3 lysine-79 specific n=1 Tax=Tetraparma gracilis TaxID=2962635 RepID=A0ABQ6MCF3_9STRA|nr:hypothetical protein TeGR_g7918 [Tetraparma gracilis]